MINDKRLGLIIDGIDIYKKWGINVQARNIGNPSKKKILETSLPYTSYVPDFSELYGGTAYEERTLQYQLNIIGSLPNRTTTQFLEVEFINFIMNKTKIKLIDEIFPGYYFLAEVRSGTDFAPLFHAGVITVNFDAYPFRIKEAKEGSPYWDDYSILDYYQEVNFVINGSKDIQLMNNGSEALYPEVKCSSDMVVKIRNKVISFKSGISTSLDFDLLKGMNYLKVTGNGSIEFEFHKELI